MSGHSKWSKVKHQKESTDALKGKLFTKLTKAIIIAVKSAHGNSDPETNFKLRMAIDNAKDLNMPKENIIRAIEKSKDRGEDSQLEECIYEAYGPSGIGLIIQAATNNKARTVSEIKYILDKNGGTLVANGAISYLFEHIGIITVNIDSNLSNNIEEVIMESGAIDYKQDDGLYYLYTSAQDLHKVKLFIESNKYKILSLDLLYRPQNPMKISDQVVYDKLLKLTNLLKESEDVQKVYTNCIFVG